MNKFLMKKSPSLDPEKKSRHIPALDGLRGVACLLVVLAHFFELAKFENINSVLIGSLGVVVFFSLSGFLMGLLYLDVYYFNEYSILRFVVARFSRIAPSYIFAICLYIIFSLFVQGFPEVNFSQAVRLFLFFGSVSVFWSIPPEVQFYGYFIAIWFFWDKLKIGGANKLILVIFMFFIIISCGFVATRHIWPGITLPSKLHLFLFGVAASLTLKFCLVQKIVENRIVQSAVCVCFVYYFYNNADYGHIYNSLLFAFIVSLCVLYSSKNIILNFIFGLPWLAFLGRASFSIYLFHGMTLRLVDLWIFDLSGKTLIKSFLAIFLSILIPVLFHVFAELKINRVCKNMLNSLTEKLSKVRY